MWVIRMINKYKLETAITVLLLSYLSNGLFFAVFIGLLVYYYKQHLSNKSKVKTKYYYGHKCS